MSSVYENRNDIHFDSTCGTLSLMGYGEVPGVQKFTIDPGKQDPGSVVIVGSEVEVGTTPGALEPGQGMLTTYLGEFARWLKNISASLGTAPLRKKMFTFTATWAVLDVDNNALPPATADFNGFFLLPQGWDNDRTQGGQPITITIPIRIVGRVKLNGVKL